VKIGYSFFKIIFMIFNYIYSIGNLNHLWKPDSTSDYI